MDFEGIAARFIDLYQNNLTLLLIIGAIALYLIAKSLKWTAIFLLILAVMIALPSTYGLLTEGDIRGVVDAIFEGSDNMPKPNQTGN